MYDINITYYIVTFSSTHQAIKFERLLLPQFDIELIPTPREVSASCGLSLKFAVEDQPEIVRVMLTENREGIKLFGFSVEDGITTVHAMRWEE